MITTSSLIFWYLCIGCIIAVRAWFRIKPYLPDIIKKCEEDRPNDSDLTSETLVLLAVSFGSVFTWPLLVFKLIPFCRLMFTNKYPFKKGVFDVK